VKPHVCVITTVTTVTREFMLRPNPNFVMKKQPNKLGFKPLNQNILVRKITKDAATEKIGSLFLPVGVNSDVTEIVEIVAVSPELYLPGDHTAGNDHRAAKAGDRALIHRGLQGTPVKVDGEDLLVLGYVNLIGVIA
jgi:co-chaperonin GroES (HSP10)